MSTSCIDSSVNVFEMNNNNNNNNDNNMNDNNDNNIGGVITDESKMDDFLEIKKDITKNINHQMKPRNIKKNVTVNDDNNDIYQYLIIDSGPIIRNAVGVTSSLWKKAKYYYTVPGVINEIRDSKAREQLNLLPFELIIQNPTNYSINIIKEFARKTGDIHSLSNVDIQILALLYDLEIKSCSGGGNINNNNNNNNIGHIRKNPKKMIGNGKILSLSKEIKAKINVIDVSNNNNVQHNEEEKNQEQFLQTLGETTEEKSVSTNTIQNIISTQKIINNNSLNVTSSTNVCSNAPKTWASLVSKEACSNSIILDSNNSNLNTNNNNEFNVADENVNVTFGNMNLIPKNNKPSNTRGQFSDASDNEDDEDDDDDDDEEYSDDDDESESSSSDDNEEEEESDIEEENDKQILELENELNSEYPSLTASLMKPYEGEDNINLLSLSVTERNILEEERKLKSLQPISKSGKSYNSFKNYKNLMKPKPILIKKDDTNTENNINNDQLSTLPNSTINQNVASSNNNQNSSRIVGGMGFSGQDDNVEDDGEGWITTKKEITSMKATGMLDPTTTAQTTSTATTTNPINTNDNTDSTTNIIIKKSKFPKGPPANQRAACTTTDFAMQNVILQMNLILLSIDGIKINKLKNWITRCGACYKIYTNNEYRIGGLGSKRLFCEHCGCGDMIQKIACSINTKNNTLRLHLSSKYKNNLRGTKFSLPKPGNGNRFQGDLLLREDQLLSGIWNQKIKIRSGGKAQNAAQSIFGNDIATNVGCYTSSMSVDDIRVGFGKQNPNSAKGRERRGKKKKTTDKACGLRRY